MTAPPLDRRRPSQYLPCWSESFLSAPTTFSSDRSAQRAGRLFVGVIFEHPVGVTGGTIAITGVICAVTGAGGSGVIPQTSKQEVGKDKTLLEKQTVATTAVNFYTNLSRIPRDEWSSEDIANLEEVNNQMQKHLNPEEQRAVVKMAKKKAPGAFEILTKELGRLRPADTSSTKLGENPWSSPRKK